MRSLRLRHGLPPGPLARDAIEGLLLAEVRAAIGPCSIGPRDDPTGGILGERMARHVAVRMSARRR